jgi:hypothetical protein
MMERSCTRCNSPRLISVYIHLSIQLSVARSPTLGNTVFTGAFVTFCPGGYICLMPSIFPSCSYKDSVGASSAAFRFHDKVKFCHFHILISRPEVSIVRTDHLQDQIGNLLLRNSNIRPPSTYSLGIPPTCPPTSPPTCPPTSPPTCVPTNSPTSPDTSLPTSSSPGRSCDKSPDVQTSSNHEQALVRRNNSWAIVQ